jgi:hypothetical protein
LGDLIIIIINPITDQSRKKINKAKAMVAILDVGKGKQTDTLLEDEYPRSVKYMLFSGR